MRRPDLSALLRLPHMIRFRLTLFYTGLAAFVLAAFVASVILEFKNYQVDNLNGAATTMMRDNFNVAQNVLYSFQCPASVRAGPHHLPLQCLSLRLPPATASDADPTDKNGTSILYLGPDGQIIPVSTNGKVVSRPGNSVLNTLPAQKDANAATKTGAPATSDVAGWHVVTLPIRASDGSRIIAQIAEPLSKVQQQVDALMRILIYAAGVLLAISAVGGWILAGRALKPIDDITRRARQITVHDLSQRINLDLEDEVGRMAATFDDMIARLEDAFERQKRFTSDASHELRTPLTVMQADLGLALARPRTAGEYHQTLVSMDEEVSRLSTIVNELLMLTRIDVDPAGMQHQTVALHELLAGLGKRVRVIAAERDIAVHADRLDPVTIIGDATRLRQLFTNLLDNAVTYTLPGGHVTIALERTREGARVLVSDTGIGIAPEHLPSIFERFYRTSEAREHNAQGTGLGLAISRSVVQAHHGEIAVRSVPGQGTTFTVTLPHDGRRPARRVYGLRALVPGSATAR